MNKGQAAIETLVILSVSIVILMVIYFGSDSRVSEVNSDIQETQIKSSLKKLADSADLVYSQTIGASTEVYVTIPPFVSEINVNSHSFEAVIPMRGGGSDDDSKIVYYAPTQLNSPTTARLRGSIDSRPGSRWIVLKNEGGYIDVFEKNDA